MTRFVSLISAVAITSSSIGFTARAETVKLSTGDCSKLVQHVPADDVTYKPGVDVRGRPVVPADLGGGSAITIPDEIDIQIGIDLADRLALREARRTGSTPGVPGPTSAVRPVLPYEGKAALGILTIKGNDAFWNGKRIAPQDEVLLAEACRKGLTAAGVTLPTHKPAVPKP
jgi:hypothetical protein